MEKDPHTFAHYSYVLALVSACILIVAFVLNARPFDVIEPIRYVFWLAMISSAAGLFFGMAARSDFKTEGGATDQDKRKLFLGLLTNGATFVLVLLAAIIAILAVALSDMTR